jgi:hypothetical protein
LLISFDRKAAPFSVRGTAGIGGDHQIAEGQGFGMIYHAATLFSPLSLNLAPL